MSVIGIENSTNIRIVELPKGDEVVAKDYSEVKRAREQIGKLNKALKGIIDEINKEEKPILLVEDSYTQLYKIAWLKLHGETVKEKTLEEMFQKKAPFAIISTRGEQNLYSFLNQEKIPEAIANKKIVGLFDFDDAYFSFKGLNEAKWGRINGSDRKGLYRKRADSDGLYALILPVPYFRRKLASKKFEENSCLEIELYFSNRILTTEHCTVDDKIPWKPYKFRGNKATFWNEVIRYDRKEFVSFRPLFDAIRKLLELGE